MADATVGDIFQVAAVGTAFNQKIIFTHYYRLSAVSAGVTVTQTRDSLALAVKGGAGGGDVLESSYLALLPPEYTLNYWRVQQIYSLRYAFVNATRNTAGTHADSTKTANQSCALVLRSINASRRSYCVKHPGPIPQSANVQSSGNIAAAYQALMTTFIGSLISNVVDLTIGAQWDPIVYNRGHVVPYENIVNGQASTTVRVMRRRTVGYGE